MGVLREGISTEVLKDNLSLVQFSSYGFVTDLKEYFRSLLRNPAGDTSIAGILNNKEGQMTCTGWFV